MPADDIGLITRASLDIQEPNALWGVQLMGGEREEVDAERLDVNLDFPGSLHGIRMAQNALAPANCSHFLDGKEDAGFVIAPHHRDDRGIGTDGFIKKMEVHGAI